VHARAGLRICRYENLMARSTATVVMGVAYLLLAGCGGSHSSPSASAPPAYLASADAICSEQLGKLSRLPQPTTPEGATSYLPKALAIMQSEVSRLTALQVPADKQAQLKAGLASEGELSNVLRGLLHKLKSGIVEISSFGELQARSDALKADVDAHFRQAGLERCAE
jgi:hypothetical protein